MVPDHNDPVGELLLGIFIGASFITIFYALIPIIGPFLAWYQTAKEGQGRKLKSVLFGEEGKRIDAMTVGFLRFITSSAGQAFVGFYFLKSVHLH